MCAPDGSSRARRCSLILADPPALRIPRRHYHARSARQSARSEASNIAAANHASERICAVSARASGKQDTLEIDRLSPSYLEDPTAGRQAASGVADSFAVHTLTRSWLRT